MYTVRKTENQKILYFNNNKYIKNVNGFELPGPKTIINGFFSRI